MFYAQTIISLKKWKTFHSLGFWDKKRSPTRKQDQVLVNKKNLSFNGFFLFPWITESNERKRKDGQILGSYQRAKEDVEHEVNSDTNSSWNGYQRLGKTGGTEDQNKSHTDSFAVRISKNT